MDSLNKPFESDMPIDGIEYSNKQLMTIFMDFPGNKWEDKYNSLKSYFLANRSVSEGESKGIKHNLSLFYTQLASKWKKAGRRMDLMTKNNENWLQKKKTFYTFSLASGSSSHVAGRPALSFESSSDRSKRRKTTDLRTKSSKNELVFATQMSLRASGEPEAASLLKEITTTTPTRASKYKRALKLYDDGKKQRMLTPQKALSIFTAAQLTRSQYNIIREPAKDIYPSYKVIQQAKAACYPDGMTVNEKFAAVPLQNLLDHTIQRIIESQKEVLLHLDENDTENLFLITKWGCDGSSGHSEYNQSFSGLASDASMFISSLVPLQLIQGPIDQPKAVIWKNPRPSSPRYCRPIKLQFLHETTESTVAEITDIETQINNLNKSFVRLQQREINVTHVLTLTMIDGKVCNAATQTKSNMRCYICNATSKNFNDLPKMMTQPVDQSRYKFGLSSLHAWIRFFEFCLHVSYKLVVCKWQIRDQDSRDKVATNKRRIQQEFKTKMGLNVDKPKVNYGSSNTGNTARRFFQNSTLSSEITGLDKDLIEKFHTILVAISCGYKINTKKFQNYCLETAQYYIGLYSWYSMPTTAHKILMHGGDVIENALLPIGQLSEEAQESRNKDIKKYRLAHSRKISRKATMTDIFNALMVSSDPFITSCRPLPRTKKSNLSKFVLSLLE